jgi:hypothetical protein
MRTWPRGQPTRTTLAGLLGAAMILPPTPARAAPPPITAPPPRTTPATSPPANTPSTSSAASPQPTTAPPSRTPSTSPAASAAQPTNPTALASPSSSTSTARPSPAPPDQAEALRLFREARALYTAGRPREAALAFERSFAAAASAEAAYNAALAHDKTGDPVATLVWFRRYLEIARKDVDPSYPLALARADELRARVAELRVEIKTPGDVRELRLDGEPVPLDSFPRLVRPGPLTLRFTGAAPGQTVDIPSEARAGETATIYFPGFARPVAAVPAPRPIVRPDPVDPAPSSHLRPLKIAFSIGAGLTGVGAVTIAVLGGLARREDRLYEESSCVEGVCPDGYDFDIREGHRLAAGRLERATNATIGVTVGLAVVTLALGIAALRESRRPRAQTRAGRVLPAPGGLLVAF